MWGFFVLHIYNILRHMKLLKLILVSVMYFIVMSCAMSKTLNLVPMKILRLKSKLSL